MRHDFAARPVYRFNERAIQAVFRHTREVGGTLILQTARDLYRGAICVISAGDVKEVLIEAVREPSEERPGGSRWKYWRYLPNEGEIIRRDWSVPTSGKRRPNAGN
ncbi:MAG: hypothetical protein OXH96_24110 [Spirochaetaceae bacterium]|nr:hypothetical protein [Spirochaetaceae bacterium]